ncbi:hypothetical protein HAALTHF_12730n [Vreelandella aquamarina]|nr:hypothetical protein HAALTHF_12730n [Halomonas axialensis]
MGCGDGWQHAGQFDQRGSWSLRSPISTSPLVSCISQGLARAERWYHRFGEASLLLSWLPVIGDPLTVLAGVMRLAWWRALLWIVLAKVPAMGC